MQDIVGHKISIGKRNTLSTSEEFILKFEILKKLHPCGFKIDFSLRILGIPIKLFFKH